MIFLEYQKLILSINPMFGGSIIEFKYDGLDILRKTPSSYERIVETSSFPLAPYANRIRCGQFSFDGRNVTLPPNFPNHAHPLHGVVWLRPWQVVAQDARSLNLRIDVAASASWPWSFTAEQRFILGPDGLSMELQVENTDHNNMPAGIGFHPYFPHADDAELQTFLDGVWLNDEAQLPIQRQARPMADWRGGARVRSASLIDNCHDGWTRTLVLNWPRRRLTVAMNASPPLDRLHIFAPPDCDYFCLEPVSHRPDAQNSTDSLADGITVLRPGEVLSGTVELSACRY